MDKLISEPLILPERVRNGDFVLNLSRGGRLRGERLCEAPREIGSSNVVPPMPTRRSLFENRKRKPALTS